MLDYASYSSFPSKNFSALLRKPTLFSVSILGITFFLRDFSIYSILIYNFFPVKCIQFFSNIDIFLFNFINAISDRKHFHPRTLLCIVCQFLCECRCFTSTYATHYAQSIIQFQSLLWLYF